MLKYVSALFIVAPAGASTLVECVDQRGDHIVVRYDQLPTGQPGPWRMQFKQRRHPDPASGALRESVDAKVIAPDAVDITVTQGRGASGPIGVRVELRDLGADRPHAFEVIFGGIVGHLRLPRCECAKTENYCGDLLAE